MSAAGFDGVAASLTRVTSDVARNFSEFAAFDLSMNEQTGAALSAARDAIATTEAGDAYIRCAIGLARIEPNPGIVSATLARALDAFLKVLDGQTLADLLQPRARLMKIFRAASTPL